MMPVCVHECVTQISPKLVQLQIFCKLAFVKGLESYMSNYEDKKTKCNCIFVL